MENIVENLCIIYKFLKLFFIFDVISSFKPGSNWGTFPPPTIQKDKKNEKG